MKKKKDFIHISIIITYIVKPMELGWLDSNPNSYFLCCCCSVPELVRFFVTPWTSAHQVPLSFTMSQSLLKFMSTEVVMLSNHLIQYTFFFFDWFTKL